MRGPLIGVLLTLAALMGWPGSIAAGGWSTVRLDSLPTDIVAGEAFDVGFTVLQHGVRPLADLQPYLMATNPQTSERLSFEATPQGAAVGHYVARVTFPNAGAWDWAINAFEGDHWMPPLSVAATGPTRNDATPTFAPAASEAGPVIGSLTTHRQLALGLGVAGLLLLLAAALLAVGSHSAVGPVFRASRPAP